jgi:hypothetical protein
MGAAENWSADMRTIRIKGFRNTLGKYGFTLARFELGHRRIKHVVIENANDVWQATRTRSTAG